MKSLTIDIDDKIYKRFRDFLDILPKGSIKIYDDDSDELSLEESKAFYSVQEKIKKQDYSDFDDYDELKKKL